MLPRDLKGEESGSKNYGGQSDEMPGKEEL
jgi:hypothetical protein